MKNYKFNFGKKIKIKSFGNSMWPILLDGDIVHIEKIDFSQLKTNDIISVRKKNRYVTHRVVYTGTDYVITRGDTNYKADGKTYKKNFLGKVIAFTRNDQQFNIEDIYLIQSSIYFEELVALIDAFIREKIDFLILKGLPLHLFFERKHPKRIYADCDILINKKQFENVVKILGKNGFKKKTSLSVTGKEMEESAEVSFDKLVNGVLVELDIHLDVVFLMGTVGKVDNLYPQKLVDEIDRYFLDKKIDITVNYRKFPILSFENLFIYLSLHIFHHNFKGTYRYELLSEVLSKKLNLIEITKTISKYNLGSFIYPVLYYYNIYFKTNDKVTSLLTELKTKKIDKITKKKIKSLDLFDADLSPGEGYSFRTLFEFSPYPLWKKILVFSDIKITYTAAWVIFKKFKKFIF